MIGKTAGVSAAATVHTQTLAHAVAIKTNMHVRISCERNFNENVNKHNHTIPWTYCTL